MSLHPEGVNLITHRVAQKEKFWHLIRQKILVTLATTFDRHALEHQHGDDSNFQGRNNGVCSLKL